MNRFPLSIDLQGKTVFLVGSGAQIRQKEEKLLPFGAVLRRVEIFTEADARQNPAMVIAADISAEEAETIHALCSRYRIPVNVVDMPQFCSFYFPALITRGDLTVSVSTGGIAPAACAYLGRQIASSLPEQTGEILDWLGSNREVFRKKGILNAAVAAAFSAGRPLSEPELDRLEEASR